jgi:hypothetical protein
MSACGGVGKPPARITRVFTPHLAPHERREAVEKLSEYNRRALTMRLQAQAANHPIHQTLEWLGGKGGTRTLDPGIMRTGPGKKAP